MIKGDKRYLNLEDQVEWNKNHIEAFLAGVETVNIFGIRVLAVVQTPEDIPLDETYSYGDAYAVGENPPYHYYVFTRSGLEAIEGTFVDIGEFPGKGEKGDKGDPGKDGENGKTPYIGANEHWWIGGVDTGVSARGPAGIGLRGPQGIKGDAGGYRLYGELSSISQLPTPTKQMQDDDAAYIISGDLWMVMGLTSLEWYNLGKVGGTGMKGDPGVGIDTMTKITTPYGEGNVTYDTTDGLHLTGQTRIDYGEGFSKQVGIDTALPIKAGVGVSVDATEDGKHIEIKADETWVNEAIDSKVNPVKSSKRTIVQPGAKGTAARIYSVSPISDSLPEGAQGYMEAGTSNFTQYSVPQRAAGGQLNLPNQLTYVPSNNQAVSKLYVDTANNATKTELDKKLDSVRNNKSYRAIPYMLSNQSTIGGYLPTQYVTTKQYKDNTIAMRGPGGYLQDYYNGTLSYCITKAEADALYAGSGGGILLTTTDGMLSAADVTNGINAFKSGTPVFIHYLGSLLADGRPVNDSYGQMVAYSKMTTGSQVQDCIVAIFSPITKMGDNLIISSDKSNSFVVCTFADSYAGYKAFYSDDKEVTRISFDEFPETATEGNIVKEVTKRIIKKRDRSIIMFNKEIYWKADVGHTEGYITYTHTGYESSKFIHKAITINTNNWSWVLNTSE